MQTHFSESDERAEHQAVNYDAQYSYLLENVDNLLQAEKLVVRELLNPSDADVASRSAKLSDLAKKLWPEEQQV